MLYMNVDEELSSLTQAELDALMRIVRIRGVGVIYTLTKSELREFMEKDKEEA